MILPMRCRLIIIIIITSRGINHMDIVTHYRKSRGHGGMSSENAANLKREKKTSVAEYHFRLLT